LLCALGLIAVGVRQSVHAQRATASGRKAVRAAATVPEPSGIVSGSLGVMVLGVLYACRFRRKLRAT
jgi:hypothetical protein